MRKQTLAENVAAYIEQNPDTNIQALINILEAAYQEAYKTGNVLATYELREAIDAAKSKLEDRFGNLAM